MSEIIVADLEELLARTGTLWRELSGARLFITGGTGFFGTWLLEAIVAANRRFGLGCHVTALSRDPARFTARAPHLATDPAVTLMAGDVRDFSFPEGPLTHVIHAATDVASSAGPATACATLDTCVTGTRRVVELARESAVARFLLVSSAAVYGLLPAELSHVAEDHAIAANGPSQLDAYAMGKQRSEKICLEATRSCSSARPLQHLTIARGFSFVGPGLPLDAHFAIGNFIRDALAGGPITIHGDGSAVRSYLYASDMVEWLLTILTRGSKDTAYNVGAEDAVSIGELASEVADVARECLANCSLFDIVVQNATTAAGAARRMVPCCRRAYEHLGLTPRVPRREAIRRTMIHALDRRSPPVPTLGAGQREPSD